MKKILITGGAGFIGSHVVRRFVNQYPEYHIYNLDALTYAGNLENLTDVEKKESYTFIKGDITDRSFINELFEKHFWDGIIHLAAESHVDRSIEDPSAFAYTNVFGTLNLLEAYLKQQTPSNRKKRFYHISTDEVYGSLSDDGFFTENSSYRPNSPYAASKAASDHFVRAYGETYQLPCVISHCSNNYGPNHFPEKFIPLCINNILNRRPIPVYGEGINTRDWLYVIDHAIAIDLIFHKGRDFETYNIGGFNEWKNIALVEYLCSLMDSKLGRLAGSSSELITFVKDRPGHDYRYAIDASKLQTELGWNPTVTFEQGLDKTVDWYLQNSEWLERVVSGAYQSYYEKQYGGYGDTELKGFS